MKIAFGSVVKNCFIFSWSPKMLLGIEAIANSVAIRINNATLPTQVRIAAAIPHGGLFGSITVAGAIAGAGVCPKVA